MEKPTKEKSPKKSKIKIAASVLTGVLALAVAGLLFLHFMPSYGFYFVKTGSMAPAIHPGDIIVTGPVGGWFTGQLAPGKVITYKQNEALVSHRIVSIENGLITTKGDANEDADAHPVTMDNIDGIYMFKIPYIGYINSFVSSRTGWFMTIIVPTIILVLFIVKDIIKEAFTASKKETNEI